MQRGYVSKPEHPNTDKKAIADIDQVFAKGDKIKLYEIERLIHEYEGNRYLEDLLKNHPAMKELFGDEGLDVSERFEEVRKQNARSRESKIKIKKLFYEKQAPEDEEKIA